MNFLFAQNFNYFFSETTATIQLKLYVNNPLIVVLQVYVFNWLGSALFDIEILLNYY